MTPLERSQQSQNINKKSPTRRKRRRRIRRRLELLPMDKKK